MLTAVVEVLIEALLEASLKLLAELLIVVAVRKLRSRFGKA